MRGEVDPQCALFTCVPLEERVARRHPLRKLRLLVECKPRSARRRPPPPARTLPSDQGWILDRGGRPD